MILEHKGFRLDINALDALAQVDKSEQAASKIQVSYAPRWKERSYLG